MRTYKLDFNKTIKGKITITIFDLTGRIVLRTAIQNRKSKRLDISALTNGMYLLSIRIENQYERTIKIIKNWTAQNNENYELSNSIL